MLIGLASQWLVNWSVFKDLMRGIHVFSFTEMGAWLFLWNCGFFHSDLDLQTTPDLYLFGFTWNTNTNMPARKGLLAPQNTFLDTIATRFDGTRKCFNCNQFLALSRRKYSWSKCPLFHVYGINVTQEYKILFSVWNMKHQDPFSCKISWKYTTVDSLLWISLNPFSLPWLPLFKICMKFVEF